VLCDFGSSVQGNGKPVSNNGGTPCYVPPEYLFADQRGCPGDIWAFGITMLFVFGLMPLPRRKWKIADVPLYQAEYTQMSEWLQEVQRISERVPEALYLLRPMLATNPKKRITAAQLVDNLLVTVSRQPINVELVA
jgi:serine/threonine protein kinase